jgi:hypothetical protein
MKTIKIMFMVLSLSVMYQFACAQCPANKVWTCRVDSCGFQECKCLFPSQVAAWTAITPPCKVYHGPPFGHGFRTEQIEPGTTINNSFESFPNPVSNSMTISFAIEQSQNVSFTIYDLTGRYVAAVTNEFYKSGRNELLWDAVKLNPGVYILQMQAGNYNAVKRISIIK